MSKALLNQYYHEVDRMRRFSGSTNEETLKTPFANLLNGLAQNRNLALVREVSIKSTIGTAIRPDGILRNILQFDYGYWESKDQKDDFEKEIELKFAKGYPRNNMLFEDTQKAVLFQEGKRYEASIYEEKAILALLDRFISYERPEVKTFNEAIRKFGEELPKILVVLRELLEQASIENETYKLQRDKFLELCRQSINAYLGVQDVREMLIQHILTEEIFVSIFDKADYHRDNNIAETLYELERTFFRGQTKENLLYSIRPYYNTIKARATEMVDHSDKQRFLKIVYENFYKAYNPKGADRLGIVYTPTEIVKFMIEGTDFLLDKHFQKTLGDKNVEILDPCTGTGTYITELIEHIPPHQLEYKFKNEIHANEMALLPYYVANLNIEAVYQAKMGKYQEFANLCFVDTLDNTGALAYAGKQNDFFGQISLENFRRIKDQNEKKISVIIGNPPYNAHQENYNLLNANRLYADIDQRIKETYIKAGTAQNQIVVYDMYVRFVRWATDRLNGNGILCFVSNSSFVNSTAFDGFRKELAKDFQEIWIVDMKGNARTSGERRRQEKGNVFDDKIRVGVALYFLVKNAKKEGCKVFYTSVEDYWVAKEKKNFLRYNSLETLVFERIRPDEKGNWLHQTDNDFEELIPLISKDVKAGKSQEAVFTLFSNGIKTKRDEWVYDLDKKNLDKKIKFLLDTYRSAQKLENPTDDLRIKWSRLLDKLAKQKVKIKYDKSLITKVLYRPFYKTFYYQAKELTDDFHRMRQIIVSENENPFIAFSGIAHTKPFHCLVAAQFTDIGFVEAAQCLPLYRYENGERKENISDWALEVFRTTFQKFETFGKLEVGKLEIEKTDIFHYVYAVLHNPEYRTKYEQNLKRDFPRIPLYEDFWQWASWGKELMELHLNYEKIEERVLRREDRANLETLSSRPKLKANKETGEIFIDEITTLSGVPKEAWDYKLGNRSALEWVLDQYKESKPSDPTILEKFNTYKFADYKEEVIELLQKVCTVSVRTVEIVGEMGKQSS